MSSREPRFGGSKLRLAPPADYVLARDVCSYGYFLLAPNEWNPTRHTLTRGFELQGGPVGVRLSQPIARTADWSSRAARGRPVLAECDRSLSRAEMSALRAQISRMLRLDEGTPTIRAFHRIDPRWKRAGRGRLFRSPTVFEDVIKTVTSCNVTWPSTMRMNRRMSEVLGARRGATPPSGAMVFPSPARLARARPATLRARCGVGYRDERIVALAKLFHTGAVDSAWLEAPDTSDDDVEAALLALPGIGPYAAGNIMQLLGRFSRLALDTESVRHGRVCLDMQGDARDIERRLRDHYEPFGEHRFRSYWFELWDYYESKRGPAWDWDPATTGATFTAAQLDTKPAKTKGPAK